MLLIFGYLGFANYGDELLATILKQELSKANPYAVIEYLSRKDSLQEQLRKLLKAKEIYAIGGMFQDLSSPLSPLYYFFVLSAAKLLGKKIIIKAQGLGPLRFSFNQMLVKIIFGLANEVSVRNKFSSDLLKQWNIKHELVEDLAWHLKNSNLENLDLDFLNTLPFPKDHKYIFICFRKHRYQFKHKTSLGVKQSNPVLPYSYKFNDNASYIFLEMQDGDHRVHQELILKNNLEKYFFLEAKDFKAEELIYILNRFCSELITMRFHAMILAKIAKVNEIKILNPQQDPKLELC